MKFAIILAGCGVYDGAEIHESVLTMLSAERNGVEYDLFAPDKEQYHVINHLTGEPSDERRNVLTEAARIARGNIAPLTEYSAAAYDAVILPGGFGVAKNLCTYAVDGTSMTIDDNISRLITETHKAGKPIGALCISPVIIASLIPGVEVTLGSDDSHNKDVDELGGRNITTGNRDIVVDSEKRVVSTPCYMNDASLIDVAEGADALIKAVAELAG